MFHSIRRRLIAMVSALIILALGISMSVSFYLLADDFIEHNRRINEILAESLAHNIQQVMENAYDISNELARNPDIVSFEPEKQERVLKAAVERYGFYQLLIVHKPDGNQTARTSGALTNRADRWWFKKFIAEGEPYIGNSYYSVFSDTPVTTMVHGIYDGGELTGVLMSNIEIATLQPMVEKYAAGSGRYAYLLDGDGVVVAHPDKMQIQEIYNYKTQKKAVLKRDEKGVALRDAKGNEVTEELDFQVPPSLQEIIAKVSAGESGIGEYRDGNGEEYVCAYRSIALPGGSDPWKLLMVQKKSFALAFINEAALTNGIICFWGLLLSIALTYWVAGRISRPLMEIAETTQRIAEGELDTAIPHSGTNDEISVLEECVERMARNLQRMVVELEERNRRLAMSEEKYAKAFRYAADAIGIVHLPSERYVEVSDAFYEVFGYAKEELLGHSSKELGLWCDIAERKSLFDAVGAGEAIHRREVRWRTKGGAERIGLCSAERILIAGQEYLLFVWHDITEMKQAEEELLQVNEALEAKVDLRTQELTALNQELRAMNETAMQTLSELRRTQEQLIEEAKMAALGRLVAGVAHEINTPVGVSVTAASYQDEQVKRMRALYQSGRLARSEMETFLTETEQSTAILLTNLGRAAELIKSFKKVSVDQSDEQKRAFNVVEYLNEIVLTLRPKFKKTKLKIEIEGDPKLHIYGRPGAFAQVVANLLDNSLVHAYEQGEEGRIRIEIKAEDNNFIMKYSDDGKGMEKEVMRQVFDPFFTTRRGRGGTGLGLNIVYSIVTQVFKGRIECESEPGQGCSFYLAFPLQSQEEV